MENYFFFFKIKNFNLWLNRKLNFRRKIVFGEFFFFNYLIMLFVYKILFFIIKKKKKKIFNIFFFFFKI
jgi:hypothetical protein